MKGSADQTIRRGFFPILLCGLLWGQVPAPAQSDPGHAAAASGARPHDNSFVIGNDDRLAINVWKEPDLTRSIPVRSDGKISLPLVGELQAAGRTPLQLEQDIANRLRNYITEPEVTVMVEQINSEKFNILGQVTKPGSYPLTAATTVMDAIATAGGFKDFAKQKGIYILRQNSRGGESRIPFNYKDFIKGKNSGQNIKLEPRDTIVVP
jgi:polysaccharide export outer membrane protein